MLNQLTYPVLGLFATGAALMAAGHRVSHPSTFERRQDWVKYGLFAAIVTGLLAAGMGGRVFLAAVLVTIATAGSVELYRNFRLHVARPVIWTVALSILIVACLAHLTIDSDASRPGSFLFVYLIVATTDSFSQLLGRLLGRHRMCPRISPAKTWEGFVGGVVSAVLVAAMMPFLLQGISNATRLALALVVALSGNAGDLGFSYLKRRLGIKDFSGALPGHGGVLDRFDSLILAGPAFYWTRLALIS